MAQQGEKERTMPPQDMEDPNREAEMVPRPRSKDEKHEGSGKLLGKVALVTGGDSGIGRAVAIASVFLASDDASYMVGQMLHPNGGTVVNG